MLNQKNAIPGSACEHRQTSIAIIDSGEAAARALRKSIGVDPIAIEPILNRGMSNEVFIAATSTERYVVRINTAAHLPTFEKEAWCLKQAADRDIPVPGVLACGTECEKAFSIANYLERTSTIREGADYLGIWNRLGRYAASLNSIRMSDTNDAKMLEWFGGSWPQAVASEMDLAFADGYLMRSGNFTSIQMDRLERSLQELSCLPQPSGLCQIDMCCENALIDRENDKLFLLDLELTAMAPVPHYQLACIARTWGLESDIFTAFREGYGITDEELRAINRDLKRLTALRMLRQAGRARQRNAHNSECENRKAIALTFGLLAGDF